MSPQAHARNFLRLVNHTGRQRGLLSGQVLAFNPFLLKTLDPFPIFQAGRAAFRDRFRSFPEINDLFQIVEARIHRLQQLEGVCGESGDPLSAWTFQTSPISIFPKRTMPACEVINPPQIGFG